MRPTGSVNLSQRGLLDGKDAEGLKIGRTRSHKVSPGGRKPSLLCMSKIPTVEWILAQC